MVDFESGREFTMEGEEVFGSTAGLTPEELAGIDKLDELLALEKVDWDDVVRIRVDAPIQLINGLPQ